MSPYLSSVNIRNMSFLTVSHNSQKERSAKAPILLTEKLALNSQPTQPISILHGLTAVKQKEALSKPINSYFFT